MKSSVDFLSFTLPGQDSIKHKYRNRGIYVSYRQNSVLS